MKTVQKSRPTAESPKRPTTLSLPQSIWDRLKAIEQETGARPSVTATRILQRDLEPEKDDS